MEEGDKRYVSAVVREDGRPAVAAILAKLLPELIAGLKFERSMRWNQTIISYSRPLRWIVALFGPDVIPFSYAGVVSGRNSRGLRPYDSPEILINDARNYGGIMRMNGIVISKEKRRELITAVSSKLAAEMGGTIPDDPGLLDEVTNLVEKPTPLRGRFSKRYLALPAEVLVAVMRKHQRYFPVYDDKNELMPYFIAVRNGDEKHLNFVVNGNVSSPVDPSLSPAGSGPAPVSSSPLLQAAASMASTSSSAIQDLRCIGCVSPGRNPPVPARGRRPSSNSVC